MVSNYRNSNALCPNRPSQNENRKRVPVRRHPLSCDFSATSQISVIAQPRACAPRPVRPGRDNRKLARHTVPGCIARNKIRPEGTAESSRIFHRRSATRSVIRVHRGRCPRLISIAASRLCVKFIPAIIHPKMNSGKEPFKCGIQIAECGMGDPQITQIAQIFSPICGIREICG